MRAETDSDSIRTVCFEGLEPRLLLSTYYVHPVNGVDANPGTLALPFKSIQKAADTVQASDTCYLRGGEYYLEDVSQGWVTLKASGTENSPIVFKAYQDEEVTIRGTREVDTTWHQDGTNNWYYTTLTGFDDPDQVFVDNEMVIQARYPNYPSATFQPGGAADGLMGLKWNATGSAGQYLTALEGDETRFDEVYGLLSDFENSDIYVWGVFGYAWNAQFGKLTGQTATPSKRFNVDEYDKTSRNYPYYAMPGSVADGQGYFTGSKELLDAPGEWHYDASTNRLYLWAPDGDSPNGVEVRATRDEASYPKQHALIDTDGYDYVKFENINFFAGSIYISDDSQGIVIDECTLEYVSHYIHHDEQKTSHVSTDEGIYVGGDNNEITNCEIAYSASQAIILKGNNNTVDNNYMHDLTYQGWVEGGITAMGHGQTITNNTIYDTGGVVIMLSHLGQGGHTVNYNDLSNPGMVAKDQGGIYAGPSYNLPDAMLALKNNAAKYTSGTNDTFTVTSDTVLEFYFKASKKGNYHGIGLYDDNPQTPASDLDVEYIWKLYGENNWEGGGTEIPTYASIYSEEIEHTWKYYRIPLGGYTGEYRLVFLYADQVGGQSCYGNIRIFSDADEDLYYYRMKMGDPFRLRFGEDEIQLTSLDGYGGAHSIDSFSETELQVEGTEIAYNWVHDVNPIDGGQGAGIYLDNNMQGVLVHHNVVWNCRDTGIGLNKAAAAHRIYHNTLWDNGYGIHSGGGDYKYTSDLKIYNNLYNNKFSGLQPVGSELHGNLSADGISASSIFEDADSNDFRLVQNSLAIDFGRDITDMGTVNDGAPDAGAYERGQDYWVPGSTLNQTPTVMVWVEAEDFDLPLVDPPFVVDDTIANASGGEYLEVDSSGYGAGTYDIEVSLPEGRYYVWGRGIGLKIQFGLQETSASGEPDNYVRWALEGTGQQWDWNRANHLVVEEVGPYGMVGNYTLFLRNWDNDAKIDRLLLTNDYYYTPSGLGDAAPSLDGDTFALSENAANGTSVGTVTGTDPDGGDTLTYSITAGDTDEAFAINSSTGEITVADYESLFDSASTYTLTVEVDDNQGMTDTATVKVLKRQMVWFEAESPTVLLTGYTSVYNSSRSNDYYLSIGSDADDPLDYSSFTAATTGKYWLWGSTNSQDAIAVAIAESTPSGNGYDEWDVAENWAWNKSNDGGEAVDYDLIAEDEYKLYLKKEDADQYVDRFLITNDPDYTPSDLGDTAPSLGDDTFAVSQNAADEASVGTVTGSDDDGGDTLTYSITAGDTDSAFAIDLSTGQIKVADSDSLFDSANNYSLTVKVDDNQGMTDTATVKVVKRQLVWFEAESPTSGLVDPFEWAEDAGRSGGAYLNNPAPLPGDGVLEYNFTTAATGEYWVWGSADNGGGLYVHVAESTPGSEDWVKWGLADEWSWNKINDSEEQGNPVVSYDLTGSQAYKVYLKEADTNREVDRLVVTNDPDYTPSGLGDAAPSVGDETFILGENAPNDASVGTVTGSDDDGGDTLTYSITAGNTDNALAINSSTGQITVADTDSLFYSANNYNLTVEVDDNQGLTDTATVKVYKRQMLWIEAEDFTINESYWEFIDDGETASGGQYLESLAPEGTPCTYDLVDVPAGTYWIWGRGKDGLGISFTVAVTNGQPPPVPPWPAWYLAEGEDWDWNRVNHFGNEIDPYELSEGDYTIWINNWNESAKLDRLLITNDPDYTPSGLGDAAPFIKKQYSWYEAESPTQDPLPGGYTKVSAGARSGDYYLSLASNADDPVDYSSFTAAMTGEYWLWGSTQTTGAKSISIAVAESGSTPDYLQWTLPTDCNWAWDKANDGQDAFVFHLAAGESYNIYLKGYGSDEVNIDRLLITNDPDYTPVHLGNLASNATAVEGQYLSVVAGAGTDTTVGTVVASDPDSGDMLTYSITVGPSGVFTIGKYTGEIKIGEQAGDLFAGGVNYHDLTVKVDDNEGHTSTGTVTISKRKQIWLEVEDFTHGASWAEQDDNAASGLKYVVAVSSGSMNEVFNDDGNDIPKGKYWIWGRGRGLTTSVRLTGPSGYKSTDDTNAGGEKLSLQGGYWAWRWAQGPDDRPDGYDYFILPNDGNDYTIYISSWDIGAKLDKILITNDPTYVPEGYGGVHPKVKVEASATTSKVEGQTEPYMYFNFTRVGATEEERCLDQAIKVDFSLGGTAIQGKDYDLKLPDQTLLNDYVVILADTEYARVNVHPLNDTLNLMLEEGTETIAVALADTELYLADSTASNTQADVNITDSYKSEAYWKLDDTGTSTVVDSSENQYDGTHKDSSGTASNVNSISGKSVGGGLDLKPSGTSYYVDSGKLSASDLGIYTSQAITVSAWINPRTLSGTRMIVGDADVFSLQLDGDKVKAEVIGTDGGSVTSTGTLSTDQWYHVGFSWQDDTCWLRVYINGSEDNKIRLWDYVGFSGTNDKHLGIGANLDGSGDPVSSDERFFEGRIDEVRICDEELSATSMAKLADEPDPANDKYYVAENDLLFVVAAGGNNIESARGILANDTSGDPADLGAKVVSDVSNGSLTMYSDGAFAYVPDAGWYGTDSFTYKAYNELGVADTATVTLEVNQALDFADYTITSYGGTEDSVATVFDGGRTLYITLNGSKKININYTITANTVLEFDFWSRTEGEIQGIGFDTDDILGDGSSFFQLYGDPDEWGNQTYNNYTGPGWKHYTINVGTILDAGVWNYLTFRNQDDLSPYGEVWFTNIRIYEST